MAYTNKQRKCILDKINSLSATEHEEIFNMLQRFAVTDSSLTYTINKNGVFFNLSTLQDEHLKDIDRFVDFCHHNKKDLDEYDKILSDCKANTSVINLNLETIVEQRTHSAKQNMALPICDWNTVSMETSIESKSAQKIIIFIERLNADKTGKKKMNVKFHNAKKKYAKKAVTDSKFEHDLLSDLTEEDYLFKDTTT